MPKPSPAIEQAIVLALSEAQHRHSSILGTPRLFIALTKLDGATAATLRALGHDPTQSLLTCVPARRLLPAAP